MVTGAVLSLAFPVAALTVWAIYTALARRDMKPANVTPPASDGSRFWGRRNAEATNGKVITKESGGSRERAAEALAVAQAEERHTTLAALREGAEMRDRLRDQLAVERAYSAGLLAALTSARADSHAEVSRLATLHARACADVSALRAERDAMRTERDALALQVNKPAECASCGPPIQFDLSRLDACEIRPRAAKCGGEACSSLVCYCGSGAARVLVSGGTPQDGTSS